MMLWTILTFTGASGHVCEAQKVRQLLVVPHQQLFILSDVSSGSHIQLTGFQECLSVLLLSVARSLYEPQPRQHQRRITHGLRVHLLKEEN